MTTPNNFLDGGVANTGIEIFELLRELRSPRDAASALCIANTLLIESQAATLEQVQNMAAEMTVQIIAQWTHRNARVSS